MLEQILFVVIVLAVASLMALDVARTRHESSHGLAEGQVSEVRRPLAAAGLGSREAFSRAHTGTAMPIAAHDRGPARHPAGQRLFSQVTELDSNPVRARDRSHWGREKPSRQRERQGASEGAM